MKLRGSPSLDHISLCRAGWNFVIASIFGGGATALGLAIGLLIQGLFFAPFDLPQYGMSFVAKRMIPANTAYKDIGYGQALALSTMYQGGIVAWVAFWSIYGGGFSAETLSATVTFGAAYMLVVLLEPLIDLAVLAGAKVLARHGNARRLIHNRLYRAA